MLSEHKDKSVKIKLFKCLVMYISLIFLIVVGFIPVFSLNSKGKLKVKINYLENPNKSDFFSHIERKHISLGRLENIKGEWKGSYNLIRKSISWINPGLDSTFVYNNIAFKEYEVCLKFKLTGDNKFETFYISQDEFEYGPVNFELVTDKQINYWTKAFSKNWVEIVRGKVFRVSPDELFTEFQTTVYEDKIPIYAFRGETVLHRI